MSRYGERRHAIFGTDPRRDVLVVASAEFIEEHEQRGRQDWEARTVGDIRRIEGVEDLDHLGYLRWPMQETRFTCPMAPVEENLVEGLSRSGVRILPSA